MSANFIPWPEEHSVALKTMVLAGAGSYAEIAAVLNAKFGSDYSRNACIGRAIRMGLPSSNPRPTQRKPKSRAESPPRFKPWKIDLPPVNKIAELRLQCVEIVPLNLALIDLESCQCRWPYGDDQITFCGHPATTGSPYCLPHYCLSIGLQIDPGRLQDKAMEVAD